MKTKFSKIIKSNYEKYVLIIYLLGFFGLLIGNISERFRYSEFRYLYQYGKLISFILMLSCLLWSLINSIFILQESYSNLKRKVFWVFVSLAPIIILIIFISLVFLQEYYSTDIQLPSGEYIAAPDN